MREQDNSRAYQSAFNEIHLSSKMKEELQNMEETKRDRIKEMRRKKVKKYVAAAAAFMAVFFVASNGVVYAQTGSTWVGKLRVYINGGEIEMEDVVLEQGEDGDGAYYVFHVGEGTGYDEDDSIEVEKTENVEP